MAKIQITCRVPEKANDEIVQIQIFENTVRWKVLLFLFELGYENHTTPSKDFGNPDSESCTLKLEDTRYSSRSEKLRLKLRTNHRNRVLREALLIGLTVFKNGKLAYQEPDDDDE